MMPIVRSRLSATGSRLGHFIASQSATLLCVIFLIVGLGVLDDYGISWDEEEYRQATKKSFQAVISGTGTGLPKDDVQYYGTAFQWSLLLVERFLGLSDSRTIYLTRHALGHLFFLLGGLGCYLLAYRLFHNRLLAGFALLLFLLHPRLYAHSFFNGQDIPFASMFMLALFLLDRAFRKDTVAAFLLCGVGIGVLTNLRIMGLMLLPVVVALRASDWLVGAVARRHVLHTMGAFVVASLVTLYVLSPYLWANPLRFGDALTVLAHHPEILTQRFQGEMFSSDEFPPHYLPTWFTITTPAVTLLLGLLGMGSVFSDALTRPGALMRQTPRRFGVVLVVCFLFPMLAVIVLGSHLIDGWRRMYFLYAPFSLLALFGLQMLITVCPRGPLRVGVYALTGLGVGLIIFDMIRLHPYQQVYFNRLVDRTTPEYLRSQYHIAYWGMVHREGLEYLLKRYPSDPIAVSSNYCWHVKRNRLILSSAARDRIVACPSNYDFYLTDTRAPLRPGIYARQVYNNTILTVEKMMLSKEDADTAAYRAAHQATIATAPIIQAAFDIYLKDDMLVYVEEPCAAAEGPVFLHIHPVDVDDLPPHRVQYAFDNHDFYWNGSGGGDDGCMRIVHLPKYEMAWLATGQYNESGQVWRETFVFPKVSTGGEVDIAVHGLAELPVGEIVRHAVGRRA